LPAHMDGNCDGASAPYTNRVVKHQACPHGWKLWINRVTWTETVTRIV